MTNNFHDLQGERVNQILITCSKYGKVTGYASRGECHRGKGIIHFAFMAFLIDREKRVILGRRSASKSLWAGYWDTAVVSHILVGEVPETAAERRVKEEMGVEADFHKIGDFYYYAPHGEGCENEFCYVLVGQTPEEVIPNPVEVSGIKKIKMADLLNDLQLHPGIYTPWLKKSLTLYRADRWKKINNWIKSMKNENKT